MLPAIRCVTCNKVIGSLYNEYNTELKKGKLSKDVLDDLGLKRVCCRRMLLTNVDLFDTLIHYS